MDPIAGILQLLARPSPVIKGAAYRYSLRPLRFLDFSFSFQETSHVRKVHSACQYDSKPKKNLEDKDIHEKKKKENVLGNRVSLALSPSGQFSN